MNRNIFLVYKAQSFAGRKSPPTDNINSTMSFPSTNAFTLEAWINLNQSALMAIYNKRATGGDPYTFDIWIGATYKLRLGIRPVGAPSEFYMTDGEPGTVLKPGVWFYPVGTYDNSKIYTYLNGTLDYSKSATGTLPSITMPLKIDAWSFNWNSVQCFDGKMDEIRISNIVRNSSWLRATYNTINGPSNFFTVKPEDSPP